MGKPESYQNKLGLTKYILFGTFFAFICLHNQIQFIVFYNSPNRIFMLVNIISLCFVDIACILFSCFLNIHG
ncbi:hypothetical protein ACJX0J_026671, partial [Zea mays]